RSTAPPLARHTLGAGSRRTRPGVSPPPDGVPRASPFFLHHRLEHLVVEREIGDDRLQPPILILECAQLARVTDLHAAVLRPPPVERVLADPVLPAKVSDLLARLRGLQDRDDLLLRESALPHQVLPTTPGGLAPFPRHQLRGAGHRHDTLRGQRPHPYRP